MNSAIYGKIQGLPEDVEPAVRIAKFSIFECVWRTRTYSDITIGGPFSFRAHEDEDSGRLDVKWNIKKSEAMARFIADDDGRAVCWLPDDRYWHNRIYLMTPPKGQEKIFQIVNYHTNKGAYPASYIQVELDCLKEELKYMRPIFKVMKNGKELEFHYNEKDAKKSIDRQAKMVTKFTQQGVINETQFEAEFAVEEGFREEFRPEIEKMIRENQKLEFGWTACPEFMNVIKPKVLAKAETLRKSNEATQPSVTKQALKAMLRELTQEEREEILGAAKTVEADEVTMAPPTEVTEPVIAKKRMGRPPKAKVGIPTT